MKKLSSVVLLVLTAAFLFGHIYYGWNLYQTLTSGEDFWAKTSFAMIFAFWLLLTIGLIIFVFMLFKERRKMIQNARRNR